MIHVLSSYGLHDRSLWPGKLSLRCSAVLACQRCLKPERSFSALRGSYAIERLAWLSELQMRVDTATLPLMHHKK